MVLRRLDPDGTDVGDVRTLRPVRVVSPRGKRHCNHKGDDQGSAIVVESDGKIVVSGTTTSTGGGSSNVFVARMLADGSLDPAFGTAKDETPDGVVNLSVVGGKTYVAGSSKQGDSSETWCWRACRVKR